jgi:hypothetical protein
MGVNVKLLLVISRDVLLNELEHGEGRAACRLLARLTRKGCHLLLTAPEPEQWSPTRGNVDDALVDQGRLQQEIHDAGGDLDGVYYVPRSLFTQDRNREGALTDILARYAASVENTLLISASTPFLRAAKRLSIDTRKVPEGRDGAGFLCRFVTEITG